MSNPAITADVEARWRPLTTPETTVANTRLDDAWVLLRSRVPDLAARLDADTDGDLTATVVRVLADAVIRLLRNPNARTQQSTAVDDATTSWTAADPKDAGRLFFTDDELADLREVNLQQRAYSIDLIADYATRFDS